MIIGFDLDGVIFKPVLPLYGLVKRINLDFLVYRFKRISSIENAFYNSIKIDRDVTKVLSRLTVLGNEIIIISGHSVKCREKVIYCLEKNKIYFDALYLRPDGNNYFNFKLDAILSSKCDFYFDDRWDLVCFLQQRLNGACQIIHYKNPSSLVGLGDLLDVYV